MSEFVKLGDKNEDGSYKTYSSFVGETPDEKKAFFNAISSPESLKNIKGKISLQHVYLEQVQYKETDEKGNAINNEDGGASYKPGIRLILIDKNGKGFKTSSIGVLNALMRMEEVMGQFPWNPAIDVVSVKRDTANGQNIRVLDFA